MCRHPWFMPYGRSVRVKYTKKRQIRKEKDINSTQRWGQSYRDLNESGSRRSLSDDRETYGDPTLPDVASVFHGSLVNLPRSLTNPPDPTRHPTPVDHPDKSVLRGLFVAVQGPERHLRAREGP